MSYERAFPLGQEEATQESNGVVVPVVDNGEQIPIDSAGNGQVSPVAVAGVLGIIGGIALFMLAIPFGVGAISGAVVAPSGRRKAAAKTGALAGGLGGLAAYPLLYGLTGSSDLASRLAGITPMALGAYMGYRERQKEDQL